MESITSKILSDMAKNEPHTPSALERSVNTDLSETDSSYNYQEEDLPDSQERGLITQAAITEDLRRKMIRLGKQQDQTPTEIDVTTADYAKETYNITSAELHTIPPAELLAYIQIEAIRTKAMDQQINTLAVLANQLQDEVDLSQEHQSLLQKEFDQLKKDHDSILQPSVEKLPSKGVPNLRRATSRLPRTPSVVPSSSPSPDPLHPTVPNRSRSIHTPQLGTSKSSKHPDPELLTDGRNPPYSTWEILMKNKLNINEDWFLGESLFETDVKKGQYTLSRIDPKSHIMNMLMTDMASQDHPDEYTATQMFLFLRSRLVNPLEKQQARQEYQQLQFNLKDIDQFIGNFVMLATKAGIPRDGWKQDFNDRLPPSVAIAMTHYILDPTFDFNAYTDSVRAQWASIQHFRERKQAQSVSKPAATTSVPQRPRPLPTTDKAMTPKVTCFNCQQSGHVARDCRYAKVENKAIEVEDDEKEQLAPLSEEDLMDDQDLYLNDLA